MKSCLFIALFSCLALSARAQDSLLIYGAIDLVQQDALKQIYCWGEGALRKYDPSGRPLALYSNKTLGKPGWLDVRNPFGLLLYFPDFQTLLLLDRNLSKIGECSLALDWQNIQALGSSRDESLWMVAGQNTRLYKINLQGKPILTGPELRNSGIMGPISSIAELEDRVCLLDRGRGLHFFDLFGQFIQSIDLAGLEEMRLLAGNILLRQGGHWQVYDALQMDLIPLAEPAPPDLSSKLIPAAGGWFVLAPDKLFFLPERP